MTFLTAKTFLKKVWLFLKTYWYIPLLLSWAVIAWLLLRNSSTSIMDVLYTAEKSYREQIEILNESHEKEIQKRDEVLKRYEDAIKQLEREKK